MQRNLRLQVMLNAVDRVTGPLKKMREGAGKTAQAMRETQGQLKELQRQQSDLTSYRKARIAERKNIRTMRDAQSRAREYTQALDRQREAHGVNESALKTSRAEYKRLSSQMLATTRPSKQLTDALERSRIRLGENQRAVDESSRTLTQYRNRSRNAGEEVKRLTQNHATQTERIRGLKTRLDEAGISTDNLGRSSRELRTKEERLNTALQEQKRHLSEVAQRQRRLTEARDRYQNGMAGVTRAQGVGMGMFGTGVAQGYMASRLLRPGVEWGEQMSTLQAVGRFDADDERYQALRQQSRDLGGSTAFSATEVGSGQEFLLRAGMSSEAIRASMRDVLDLALANNTELGRAADIASNIAGAFKIDMEADGSMARVADILSGTASRANVDLEMLGNTMKYLGGAEDLKLTMEQAAAMSGILGNIGVQGSQAGTTMRAMMNRLTNPAAKGAAAIENIGLQIADANGNMRAMPEILRDISQATADLGNVERKAIMQDIFGTEAGSGMAELVNSMGSGQLDEILNALGENMGENARMAATMTDNIGGDLKELQSAWAEVGISITDTNDGPLRDLIQSITSITQSVGDWIKANPELAGTIAKVAGGMIALATVGGAVTMTFASILSPLLFARFAMASLGIRAAWLGKGFKLLGGATIWLARAGLAVLAGSLKIIGGVLLATLKASGAFLMGLRALGAILLAVGKGVMVSLLGALKATAIFLATNPIGWAIMAIAGAAFLIIKYWEPIKAFFSGLWQQIKDAFGDGIGGVSRLLVNWSPLGLMWAGISSALGRLGIELPDSLTELGSQMIGGLANGMTNAKDWVRQAAGDVWAALEEAFAGGIGGVSRLLLDWSPLGLLHTAFVSGLDALGIEVPEGFRTLGGFIIDGLIGGITGKLGALRERITGLATSAMDWFKGVLGINSPSRVFAGYGANIVEGIIGGINNMAGALRDHVVGLAGNIAGWMSDTVSGAVDVGRDIANGMADGIRSGARGAWDAVTGLARGTEDTAREQLDTHSPSRVFKDIGIDVAGGLRDGIKGGASGPLEQVRSLTDRLKNAAAGLMLGAGIASPAIALEVERPTPSDMPSLYTEVAKPETPTLDALQIERPDLPRLSALEIQRPELPRLYSEVATPETPVLDALQIERPDLPHVDALEIQRPELPKLEALDFEWPELPQFDPLRIDTSAVQIDARPPLQSEAATASVNVTINLGGITVNAAPGMDEQALARLVNQQVERALRDAERRAAAATRRNFYDND